MNKVLTSALLFATTISVAPVHTRLVAQAQPPASGAPPKVMMIGREEVKPGKGSAHADWETGWPAAYAKVNYPTNYLAMTSISGDNSAWFMVGYPSFAAAERDNAMQDANASLSTELKRLSAGDGDFLTNSSNVMAENVAELNHGGNVEIAKMRYMEVLTYRMRPGHDDDFGKMASMVRDAYTKAKLNRPWAIYRVVSGMPGGTYLVLLPLRSLALLDSGATQDRAMVQAMGSEAMASLNKMSEGGVAIVNSQIFAFSPKMSYVSKEFKASDPTFWK